MILRWIIGIIVLLWGVFATIGSFVDLKKDREKLKRRQNIWSALFGVLMVFVGILIVPHSTAKSFSSSKATAATTKNTANISSSNDSTGTTYSVAHPVPKSYMQDYLSFMAEFYREFHTQIDNGGANFDQGIWGSMLAANNQNGWDKYSDVAYQTNNTENATLRNERLDVAQAWTMLNGLVMDYDTYLHGDTSVTKAKLAQDEQEYQTAYQKAQQDLK